MTIFGLHLYLELHVPIFGAWGWHTYLQEPLGSGRGMFGSHALKAVWEEQREPALPHPLVLAGAHKLVDDALSRVVEVSELRLPADQYVRGAEGEAQLEPQHGKLAERAVADRVAGLVGRDVGQKAAEKQGREMKITIYKDCLNRMSL